MPNLHSTEDDVTICELPKFPGGAAKSTAIEWEGAHIETPLPASHIIETAWAITLQLYTRFARICFGVVEGTQDGVDRSSIRSCEIGQHERLDTLVSRLQLYLQQSHTARNSDQYRFNTAVVRGTSFPDSSLKSGIDVAVRITESTVGLIFRRSFMSGVEATNMAATFTHVLESIVNGEVETVRELSITQQDMDQIIAWNSADLIPINQQWTLHREFSQSAHKQPDREAIDSWDGRMTYRELDSVSTALAKELRRKGVGPGSWVLFCFHKSRWAVVSILAILKAGGACVPLDSRHPPSRVRQIIEKTGAKHALIGSEETAALLASSDSQINIIDARNNVDRQVEDMETSWPKVDAHSPAMCLFTSGSTGTPKGIVVPHGHLCLATQAYKDHFGADENTRVLQFSSYTFDISIADTFVALLYGGTLCIPSEEDRVDGLQDYIVRTRTTWAILTPTVARQLEPVVTKESLNTLMLVGEPVRDSDIEPWVDAGVPIYNAYGPTENALITTATQAHKGRGSNIGYGVNTHTWVVDMDSETFVPIGAVGELVIESTHLTLGYLDEPEKTRASFIDNIDFIVDLNTDIDESDTGNKRRFYRTGDLVRYCEDGSLLYVGRADNQVKHGGQRIELGDIESHLQTDLKIRRVAVFLPSAGPLARRLTAIVCSQETTSDLSNATPSLSSCDAGFMSESVNKLGQTLPSYMIPSTWLEINRFPTSATGKTDKKALLSMLESLTWDAYNELSTGGEEDDTEMDSLSDDQKLLKDACSKVLNISPSKVLLSKSFIALGGDSITAMQVSFAMKKSAKKTISVKELLTRSSLLEAATCCVDLSSTVSSASRQVQLGKRYPLSPIQRLFLETATTPATWNHYHQSMLIKLEEPRTPQEVEAALLAVIRRHPILRARFEKQPDGEEWSQYIIPAGESGLAVDFINKETGPDDREAAMLRARQSIDIVKGPLLQAQLFAADSNYPKMLLFIVVHHLIVDLVSWRTILDEIEVALTTTLSASDEASYEESTPFVAWSDLQSKLAQDVQPRRTIPFKQPLPPDPNFAYWGLDASENVYRDVQETRITLDGAVGDRVLYDCHQAMRTEPIDILLAAIIVSFKRSFPDRQVPTIFNEGHGREPWDETLDISRTVGWFTTMSPVHVSDMNAWDVVDVVRRVKDYRRGTANNGFDYFSSMYLNEEGRKSFGGHMPSEVLFNYEGRYQAMEKQQSFLKPEMWHAGEALADQSPDLRRFCLFELAAAVLDGQLHLTCAWNKRARHQERIGLWLNSLLPAAIGEVTAVLMHSAPRQLTLSDVELLELNDYTEVDSLTASVLSVPGVRSIDDVEDILPGSPIQNSLALSQSKTDDGAYEIEMTWDVTNRTSKIDSEILAAAWKDTVARHPMLRTVILEAANAESTSMIHQVVLKSFQPDCILLEANDTAHAIKLLEAFPLYKSEGLFSDKKPPHRLLICRTLEGKTLVRLQMNHIVFDGMSTTSLLRDLAGAYGRVASGRKAPLVGKNMRSLYTSFLQYILDPSRRESGLAYWKEYLIGAGPCLFPALIDSSGVLSESHSHKPHQKQQKQQRGTVPVHLSIGTSEIQATLQRLEVTLPALFQMVWALLLKKYTGGSQSVFGYLTSGRDAPVDGIEDAIGPFISMLVCYVDFERNRDVSVGDIVKTVQKASANSIGHQGISLAEVQNALQLPGSTRLFNSGLTFLPRMTTEMQAKEDWALLFDEVSTHDPTEYDLSLIVETGDQANDEISLHLDYLESSIGKEHAANIASTVNHILEEMIRDPSAKVDDLATLGQSDWNKIKSWNESLIEPVEDCTHRLFARRVKEHPDREAVYSWDGSLTYKELDDLAELVAKHLIASHGVRVEQMIPVCFEKSLWTVVAILAILKAGGCFVLLDPSQPESRLWTIIDEVEASIMLCSPLASKNKDLRAKVEKRQNSLTLLELDAALVDKIRSTEKADINLNSVPVTPDNAMYVVFTSGTTGTPKGAVATHRAFSTGLHQLAESAGMTAQGSNLRSLQFASYTFDPSIGDMFSTIEVGGCMCIPRDEDRTSSDVTAFISRSRANWAGTTPSFASLLDPSSLPTVKALCLGGEALSASVVEAWSERVQLVNMYGPSECTVACIVNENVSKTTSASNIGRGFRAVTWIVDPDNHDRLQPIGAIGELLIEGPILCRGYLKRPEQTAKVFIDSPSWLKTLRPESRLYKTGDLVRYNADGALSFVGRKDTQIKINGQRVEIGEIEHALRSCLNIPEEGPVVVDLLKRGKLGESDLLTAFICVGKSKSDTDGNDQDIISKSHGSLAKLQLLVDRFQDPHSAVSLLPQYMMPQAYIPLKRLPLTPSRKVDRRALQQVCAQLSRNELLGFGSLASLSKAATTAAVGITTTSAERRLGQMWEKVLHVTGVSRSSNFFRLGGNSMSAIGLRSEARRCGVSLSVADIFAHPVLSDMAMLIPSRDSSSSSEASSVLEFVSEDVTPHRSVTPASIIPSGSDYASSAPDVETEQVKPFSLLELEDEVLAEEIMEVAATCGVSPDDIEDMFPSTPMQEALMVLASNTESRGAYGMHAPFELPQDLDKQKFQSAWEETTALHSILRSRVVSRRGRSLVVVTKPAILVRQVTASSLSKFLDDEGDDHFEHGSSLCRLSLVHDEGDGQMYFVFGSHHAMYDGWSVKLIFKTFLKLYRDGIIPHSGPSFSVFAKELCLMNQHEAEEYWRGALADNDEEGFEFPIYPRSHKPVVKSNFRLDDLPFNPAVAADMGVTVTTLIHAAWALTLSQYSSSRVVNFGITLTGRDFPMEDVEHVVGPTIVTTPRQLVVSPEQTVAEFIQGVHAVAVASLRYQHLGLHQIQALGPAARRACDFTSLLVVNNTDGDDFDASLETVGMVPVDIHAPDFHPYPIVVECFSGRQHLNLRVGFDPQCIDEPMVSRAMEQFQHNLQAVCRSSSAAVDLATVMTDVAPSHVQRILEWTDATRSVQDPTKVTKVHEKLEQRAREHPSELAIVSHDAPQGLTTSDLSKYSDTLARRILRLGLITKEAPFVAICMENCAVALVSMLAIVKAGGAFMPLNPSQPQTRVRSLTEQADARLVLVSPSCHHIFSDVKYRVLPITMGDIIQEHEQKQTETEESLVVADSRDLAYLIYTSGTTGNPKGVAIEHGAWGCQMSALVDYFKLEPRQRVLQFARYNFDACIFEIFIVLLSGASVFIPAYEEKMNNLESYLLTNDVNTIVLTPTVARMLRPENLDLVTHILFLGEALTQSDIDAWTNSTRRISNVYGPSETCFAVNAREVTPPMKLGDELKTCNNIGHAIGAAEWVMNPAQKTALVPIGAIGELLIEGPSLARGYHNDPEKTRVSFPNHILDGLPGRREKPGGRMYCSGDLVRVLTDGSFEYMGRRDGQVKLRGQRIDVGEIEHHIHTLMSERPEFENVRVQLYKPSASEDSTDPVHRIEPYLAALVVMKGIPLAYEVLGVACQSMHMSQDGRSETELQSLAKDLRRKLRTVLPDYMVPSTFVALERLPLAPTGKLDRPFIQTCLHELSKKSLSAERQLHSQSPTTLSEDEELIQKWWATILGIDPLLVGPGSDFFALGGNSVSAMRLVGLARSFRYTLRHEDIFTFPALSDMALRLAEITGDETKDVDESLRQQFDLITREAVDSLLNDASTVHGFSPDSVQDVFPCTPLQEHLMAATSRHPGAYTIVETVDVPTSKFEAGKRAWEAVFKAFDILRTRIVLDSNQGALQVVLKKPRALEWQEVSSVDDFVELIRETTGYGEPLARVAVVERSAQENTAGEETRRILFSAHHAVYDGVFLANVWQRLTHEMSTSRISTIARKPNTVTPFKAFIRHMLSQDKSQSVEFWQDKLAGLSNTAFPPQPHKTKAASERTPLATEMISRSISFPTNRKLGTAVTAATVAHAAWALTISHYTANADTLFGATLSGREAAAASISDPESIAGPTITTVPYRTVIDYNSTVSGFLTGVQRDAVRTVQYGQLGLGAIARISEDCRQACQFESIFVVQPPVSEAGSDSSGLVRRRVDTAKYFPTALAAEVQLSEDANEAVLHLVYDPIILQGSLSQHILDTFATILSNLFHATPEASLSSISAISADHMSDIIKTGHAPSEDHELGDHCVHSLVRKQVERGPLLPAIEAWDGSMSYAELDDLSSSLAAKLVRQGVEPDKSVCFLIEKSKWAIVAMLGIAKAGGCFIPLDPKLPLQRLQFLVETSKSTVILTSTQNLSVCAPLPCKAIVVNETTLPTPTAEFLKPPPLLRAPVEPHHAAYVLFTSGSTGTPKGVVVEHKALCSAITAFAKRMGYGVQSKVLQFNSYWFDPMLLDIFGTLTHGGCICIPSEDERMNDLEGAINRFNADSIIVSASVSRVFEPSRVPSLKTLCCGGEAILPSDAARWSSEVRLVSGYGPTETCIVSVFGEIKPSTPSNVIGKPVASRQWVVNPIKEHELAPLGAIGELCTGGSNLARGYLGDEAKTAASFIVDPPWMPRTQDEIAGSSRRAYRTGDLVFFNPDGTLTYVGRMGSSQVKIRGQRVELAEIEETIRKHVPSSVRVAVDVFHASEEQDEKRRTILGAVFGVGDISSNSSLEDAQVSSFMQSLTHDLLPKLTGSLPAHMVPEVYVPIAEIPLSTSGKLDRKTLQKIAAPLAFSLSRGDSSGATRQPPSTAMEKLICSAWVKVLGIQDEAAVSKWDNFISLGGDSIMSMRLITVLRPLQVSLTVVNIFKHPTIAGMAAVAKSLNEDTEAETDAEAAQRTVDDTKDTHVTEQPILSDQSTSLALTQKINETIQPCTAYQRTFIHGANTFSNAHGLHFIFSLDNTVDMTRLRTAFDHCATWFPTLRTRILPDAASGKLVQAISPVGTSLSWCHFITESGSFEPVVAEEQRFPPGADGRPLHRISVVSQIGKPPGSKTVLIWNLNHAAYDGWSLGMMLEHIEQAYVDPNFKPSYILPFSKFVDQATVTALESQSFWEKYLEGIKPATVLFNYATVKEPRQNCITKHKFTFPVKKHQNATAASVVIAAWALVLAHLTNTRDIVLAHLVTGRTMSLAGIETCPGPTISKVPLRIRLPEEPEPLPSLEAVATIVSAELVRVMPYEQGGLDAIEKLIPTSCASSSSMHAGALMGRLPLDLGIHPKGSLDFSAGEGIGMQRLEMRPSAPPPGAFSVECSLLPGSETGQGEGHEKTAGIELAALWDDRAASEEDVKELMSLLEDTLTV